MKAQQSGRALYSPAEAFSILRRALRAMPELRRGEKRGTISPRFKERLMLAVTEVNGCALCSYVHTQAALEAGLSDAEIAALLAGAADNVPAGELPALLFAQHYADTRGKPSPEAWRRIRSEYGEARAGAILSAIQVIMLGNTYGIPLGSLRARLRKQPEQVNPRSSLPYELTMLLLLIVYLPCGAAAAGISSALRLPR